MAENSHDASSCPLLERILKTEMRQNLQLPDDFAEQWGQMKQQMLEVHSAIYNGNGTGILRRLGDVEKRQWYISGATAFLVLAAGLVAKFWH